MIVRPSTMWLGVAVALALGATQSHAQPAQQQPTPIAPQPQEPAPGADLEGGENLPPPRPAEDIPRLTPETAAGAIRPLPPELPDRTKELLGDTTIVLDIPLAQIPNYRDRMRETIEELSRYARGRNPNFVLLTHGGFDLFTWSQREFDLAQLKRPVVDTSAADTTAPAGYPMRQFMQSVDGYVLNGFFCSPLRVPAADVAEMRSEALKALSIDHCPPNLVADAFRQAAASGMVAHVDGDVNVDPENRFARVPSARPVPENAASVENIGQARSMLVNLNSRGYETKDAWLAALGDTNHDVLVITGFHNGDRALSRAEIERLKFKKLGARRLVLAWLDVGHAEDEKYYWKREWGVGNPSWIVAFDRAQPGRYHIEFWNPAWRSIVGQSFAGLMDLGFDGIVLAGVESYRRWEAMTPIN